MTDKDHRAQRDAVRASLLLADSRRDRHEIYVRVELRPCPTCGKRGGFLFCVLCDSKEAA